MICFNPPPYSLVDCNGLRGFGNVSRPVLDKLLEASCPGYDTPGGTFKPFRMEIDHYSDEYDNAPMPYSIFFTQTGNAIHGTYEQRNLGRAVSHGCVRLSVKNAATLWNLVKQEKKIGRASCRERL